MSRESINPTRKLVTKINLSPSLFFPLSLLVVDQELPHSPDGIISFSLTHFSLPSRSLPLPSVSSSVPSAMLLISIL